MRPLLALAWSGLLTGGCGTLVAISLQQLNQFLNMSGRRKIKDIEKNNVQRSLRSKDPKDQSTPSRLPTSQGMPQSSQKPPPTPTSPSQILTEFQRRQALNPICAVCLKTISEVNGIQDIAETENELKDNLNKVKLLSDNLQHFLINSNRVQSEIDRINSFEQKLKNHEDQIHGQLKDITSLMKDLSHPTTLYDKLDSSLDTICSQIDQLMSSRDAPLPHSPDQEIIRKLDQVLSASQNSSTITAPSVTPPINHQYVVPVPAYFNVIENCLGKEELSSLKEYLDKEQFEPRGTSRETSYYGDYFYKYGNVHHAARPLPPELQCVLNVIKEQFPETEVNSCLITKYRDGNSFCPSHADNEPSLSPTDKIFGLSINATRNMRFDSIHSDESLEVPLIDNSLLVLDRISQSHWKHSIPVDQSVNGIRYSLTIRNIKPFYVNSTRLYGDSNTTYIGFGTGPKTLGRWCPGSRIPTARVANLPKPVDVPPVRNIVFHTGLNDLRDRYNPITPTQIAQIMESKCAEIHRLHPTMRIFLSPLLPTQDQKLNSVIRETNWHIDQLAKKHHNLFMIDSNVFADREGILLSSLASRKEHNSVHLNLSGIIRLGLLFRGYVTSRAGPVDGMNYSSAVRYGSGSGGQVSQGRVSNVNMRRGSAPRMNVSGVNRMSQMRVGNINMMMEPFTANSQCPVSPLPLSSFP